MESDIFIEAARDCIIVANTLSNIDKVAYYSKSSDSVFYGSKQISDVLTYSICGITYGALRDKLLKGHDLSSDEAEYLVKSLLETGLLRINEYANGNDKRSINSSYKTKTKTDPVAFLHLTNECNLKCPYCYSRDTRKYPIGKQLDKEAWHNILLELNEYGLKHIIVTGGEPFLEKDLIESLSVWRRMGNYAEVITNGTLITYNDIALIRNVFNKVTISIDSDCNDDANKLRGPDVYDKVMRSINLLKSEDISWKINSTLTKKNIARFHEIEQFYLDLGAESVKPTILDSQIDSDPLAPSLYDAEKYYIKKYTQMRRDISSGNKSNAPNLWYACGAGVREFAIDPVGYVYPCRLMMSKQWRCGQLGVSRFEDIWENSDILNSIREYLVEENKCSNCLLSKHCRGGCLARSDSTPHTYKECNSLYHCNLQKIVVPQHIELNCFLNEVKHERKEVSQLESD